MTLTVVYAAGTGHVLAALDSVGAAPPTVESVAGASLTVRPAAAVPVGGEAGRVPVPVGAARLAIAPVAPEPRALSDPHGYALDAASGTLRRLVDGWADDPITIEGNEITVRLPGQAAPDAPALIVVAGADGDTVELPATAQDRVVRVRAALAAGPYTVLALVRELTVRADVIQAGG